MAKWTDVERLALSFPETAEGTSFGNRAWKVRGKTFAWERPLRARDIADLGDLAPDGPILGVRVGDLGVKEALLASEPEYCFTIPHFKSYAAVLVQLDRIPAAELQELLADGWLSQAPKKLAQQFVADAG